MCKNNSVNEMVYRTRLILYFNQFASHFNILKYFFTDLCLLFQKLIKIYINVQLNYNVFNELVFFTDLCLLDLFYR